VFRRMLLAMSIAMATTSVAYAAGEAAGCPADGEAVAAAAATASLSAGQPAASPAACATESVATVMEMASSVGQNTISSNDRLCDSTLRPALRRHIDPGQIN